MSRNFGGVESLFLNLCSCDNEAKPSELTIDFVCTDSSAAREKDFINCGSKVLHVARPSQNLFKFIRTYYRAFKSNKYDIYHVNVTRFRFPLDIIIAKFCGVKVVVHCHSTKIYNNGSKRTRYIRIIEQAIFRPVFRFCSDLNLACCNTAAQYLFKDTEYKILYNGINIQKFFFDDNARQKIRQELGLQGKKVIGHIGRFTDEKNHIYMLEILKVLLSYDKNYRLLCIGDGDLFEFIKEKAIADNLDQYIVFTGLRTDTSALLSAMDAFILPSIHEALPITLIEAQANGLPCFISDCVTDEIDILNTVNRLSINEDPAIWAKALNQINQCSRNIKDPRIFDDFNIIAVKEKLTNLYRNIL